MTFQLLKDDSVRWYLLLAEIESIITSTRTLICCLVDILLKLKWLEELQFSVLDFVTQITYSRVEPGRFL